jgi:hypothetical protein
MSDKSKPQYYSLPLKRALNMMTDAERGMKLFAENVKTLVEKHSIEEWNESAIPDYMDAYLNAKVLRDYLQRLIENPDENIAAYLKSNKVDGILMSRDDLSMLWRLSTNFEETKEHINKLYGFSTLLN